MELKFCDKDIHLQTLDFLVYPVLQNSQTIKALLKFLNVSQQLVQRFEREEFVGKKGEVFSFELQQTMIIFYGTGCEKKIEPDDFRQVAGFVSRYAHKNHAQNVGVDFSRIIKFGEDKKYYAQAFAEGFYLGAYSFHKYKSKKDIDIKVQTLSFFLASNVKKTWNLFWERGVLFAQATILARDLVNEPAATMTPSLLADIALSIAKKDKQVKVKILDKEQVTQLGMKAFLAVDKGSDEPLKFIHLVYQPQGKTKTKIALVGKGITFDSGGLNIKVGDGMTDMKIDMGGAATVLGVFQVLSQLNIKAEVHGIIAACENMPSGKALRPGDVVTNMQGKTIEIGNTDAEGRVTLADALAYAQKQDVDTIVDLATLTGACVVALGSSYAALYANQEHLAKSLLVAAAGSAEKIWQMPLVSEYKELNKSQIADIRNIANARGGGSITAALFLQEFIENKVAWAHLDIAGPVYAEKEINFYTPVGGVGFGVRTLLTWLQKF